MARGGNGSCYPIWAYLVTRGYRHSSRRLRSAQKYAALDGRPQPPEAVQAQELDGRGQGLSGEAKRSPSHRGLGGTNTVRQSADSAFWTVLFPYRAAYFYMVEHIFGVSWDEFLGKFLGTILGTNGG
jgi:hypothetical protein